MNKKRIIPIIATFLIVQSTGIWSQNHKKDIGPINIELADVAGINMEGNQVTLSQAIKLAIEKNKDILTGKYDVAMTDSNFIKYQKKYSTFLNIDGELKNSKYPDAWHYSSSYGKNKQALDFTTAIAKKFETGTTITGGYTQNYSHTTWPDNLEYDEHGNHSILFASLEQEFMKNAFGYNDRREQKLLKNSAQMQKDYIVYSLSRIIVQVIVDYWDVVIKKSQLDNSQLMLKETKRVKNISAGNVKLGLAENFIINYWNALVAQAEASVAKSTQNYNDSLRNLLQKIDMDEKNINMGTIVLANKLPQINEEEALKKAFAKRVDYLNAIKGLENANLQLEIYRNNALPSIKGSLSVLSQEYKENIGEANGGAISFKNPTVEAKIALTYPLNDTEQKINERNALWQLEQSKHQINKYKRIVKDEVRSAIEKIKTNHEIYTKARKGRIESEIYYKRLLTSLRRGRYTASDVRAALDGLIAGKEAELQTLIAYNAAIIQFETVKNELFESYGIDIEKYIPKK